MLNCVISLDPKMVLNPVLEALLPWYCIILMLLPAFFLFPYAISDSPLPKKTVSVSPGSSDSLCLKHQPPFPCSHPWAFGWCCSLTLSLFLMPALSLPLCPVPIIHSVQVSYGLNLSDCPGTYCLWLLSETGIRAIPTSATYITVCWLFQWLLTVVLTSWFLPLDLHSLLSHSSSQSMGLGKS